MGAEVSALAKYAPFICEDFYVFFTTLTWRAEEEDLEEAVKEDRRHPEEKL